MAILQSPSGTWTADENKAFEVLMAVHFRDKDRWTKIAAKLPGKTTRELQRHFQLLEADVLRIQDEAMAAASSGRDEQQPAHPPAKRQKVKPSAAPRKGVAWTEEEHRLFLLGLSKFGKGSWRSIARQYVVTRTSTQVASHAQKYFLRLNTVKDKKEKRRASIHDISL